MILSFVFDVLIAMLLVITISFCVLLSRRLKRLKSDEQNMRAVVADIMQSTGKAEHAIRTLKATADEYEHTLSAHLREGELVIHDLKTSTTSAENVARRMVEVISIAKTAGQFDRKPERPAPLPANGHMTASVAQVGPPVETPPAPETPEPAARQVSALDRLRAKAA